MNLTGGALTFNERLNHVERLYPVLAGVSYRLLNPGDRVVPRVGVKAGYTYADHSEKSNHWFTGVVDVNVTIRIAGGFSLDAGAGLVVADFRGNAQGPLGLLFKVGLSHRLF